MSDEKWSYAAGERPHTVTVYEREPGGILYVRFWNPTARGGEGNWRRKSLGHHDKTRAKKYARKKASAWENGEAQLAQGKVSLAHVFAAYVKHRTPEKSDAKQADDLRRVEMWTRFLGGNLDPHEISGEEWSRFIEARGSGAVDARGNPVPANDRRPVRKRTVEIDLKFLRAVFSWAADWKGPSGYLMRENPVQGTRGRKSSTFPLPKEKNPRRPVASQDRLEALRAVTDSHTMEIRAYGEREGVRSYLSELLDIVNGTGRRISSVCALRYDDLQLARSESRPHGALRWRAETDKQGKETVIPISPGVRAAVDRILRERPGVGALPLFPAPGDLSKPMSRHLADKWLREGEKLAELEPQKGTLWHAYRRKWVTERKHLPDTDVAAAGGWDSLEALRQAYQQADDATTLSVVMGGGELREAK